MTARFHFRGVGKSDPSHRREYRMSHPNNASTWQNIRYANRDALAPRDSPMTARPACSFSKEQNPSEIACAHRRPLEPQLGDPQACVLIDGHIQEIWPLQNTRLHRLDRPAPSLPRSPSNEQYRSCVLSPWALWRLGEYPVFPCLRSRLEYIWR